MGKILLVIGIAAGAKDREKWKLGIIDSPIINAYSGGRGIFYLTEGFMTLIPKLQTALFAHEVAHEVLGHAGQSVALKATLSAIVRMDGRSAEAENKPARANLSPRTVKINTALIVRKFRRTKELEADRKAACILFKAVRGKNMDRIRLMRRFFQHLADRGHPGGGPFDAHPYPGERAAQLGAILSGRENPCGKYDSDLVSIPYEVFLVMLIG